jgi:hypothetical protein
MTQIGNNMETNDKVEGLIQEKKKEIGATGRTGIPFFQREGIGRIGNMERKLPMEHASG